MAGIFPPWRLIRLSARLVAGRWYLVAALLPLLWPAFQAILLLSGGAQEAAEPSDAQNFLIGLPMSVLAIFLGVRIIAGESDARRLELAYTVPGGSHRMWLGKLVAAWGLLLISEALLAVVAFAFFTSYPLSALYGALQAATFYLVLAMGLAALFKSEVTGAMVAAGILVLNGLFLSGRVSPMWNVLSRRAMDPSTAFEWTLQNRIGFALVIAGLTALAFVRAERREKML